MAASRRQTVDIISVNSRTKSAAASHLDASAAVDISQIFNAGLCLLAVRASLTHCSQSRHISSLFPLQRGDLNARIVFSAAHFVSSLPFSLNSQTAGALKS